MAFLKKFFQSNKKDNWLAQDSQQRQQAVQKIDDQQKLLDIIEQDKDTQVLTLAVNNIQQTDTLDQLCQHDNATVRQQAKQQRLQQLLPDTAQLSAINDSHQLERIAELSEQSDIRLQAISQISDQEKRLNIVLNSPVAKVRLAAAQGIGEQDKLQTILAFAQNKDKALYRACKTQLDNFKQQQVAIEKQQQACLQLLKSAEHLASHAYSPDYNGRLQLLKKHFEQQANFLTESQTALVEQNLAKASSVVEANAEQERQQQQLITDQKNAVVEQQQILATLNELVGAPLPEAAELTATLEQLEQNWLHSQKLNKSDRDNQKLYQNRLQLLKLADSTLQQLEKNAESIEKLIQQADQAHDLNQLEKNNKYIANQLNSLNWPDISSPAPAKINQLKASQQQLLEKLQQLQGNENSALQQLQQQLAEFSSAINDGQSKQASKLQGKLAQQFKKVSAHKCKAEQQQFRAFTAQLDEIRDWQGFAATPKKQALVQDMQALTECTLSPVLLADKIHDLQDQWKTLGQAENDKELWKQFHSAAELAYQPCKEHFAEVAEQRQINLAQRLQLIEQLSGYEQSMDWSQADWKAVQKTLDTARDAFHTYAPVDRAQHKSSQTAFKTICDKIYQHLKDEYQRNIELKEAIIAQVEALAGHDDLDFAIEQTKSQQNQWKGIGQTPHKAEQALWKKLRSASDVIFARRQEQKEQHKVDIQQQIDQAEALVKEAEVLANSSDGDSRQQLKDKLQTFQQISLPKGVEHNLRQRFNKAQEQQQQGEQQARLAKQQQTWHNLVSALTAKAAKTEIDSSALPAEIDQAQLATAGDTDEAQLRNCCIALEIIADLPTPAEDQQARMAYQVTRLANNMGQGKTAKAEVLEVINQWFAAGADTQWQTRFNQSLNQLINNNTF